MLEGFTQQFIDTFGTLFDDDFTSPHRDPEELNKQTSWTDKRGITHIYVWDTGKEYELINDEWIERSPF